MSIAPCVVVVGAGMSGLAAAYRLTCSGYHPIVFESEDRVGGRLYTCYQDGYTLDLGAQLLHACYDTTFALCRELGLSDKVVRFKATFNIAREGRLCRQTEVLDSWRKTLSMARLRLVLWCQRRRLKIDQPTMSHGFDDCSFAEYILQRNGRELLEDLFQPCIASLVHEGPETLSTGCGLTYLRCALGDAYTLARGMGTLATKLAEKIDSVYLSSPVTKVILQGGKVAGVQVLREGKEEFISCDAVIVAVPAPIALNLMSDLPVSLQGVLRKIKYSSSIHIVFGLYRPLIQETYAVVIPARIGLRFASLLEDAHKCPSYAPPSAGLVHVVVHGPKVGALQTQSNETIAELVAHDIRQVAPNFPSNPLFSRVERWRHSVCLFAPGQARAVMAFQQGVRSIRGLYVAGDYIKIPSVEGALCSGLESAEAYLQRVSP